MTKILIVLCVLGATALGFGPVPEIGFQEGVQIVSVGELSFIRQPDGSYLAVTGSIVDEAIEILAAGGATSVSTVLHDPNTGLDFTITTVRGENETMKHWKKTHMDAVLFWQKEFADQWLEEHSKKTKDAWMQRAGYSSLTLLAA